MDINSVKKRKSLLTNFLILILLLCGIILLLYPTISNYWNSFHSSMAISNYKKQLTEIDENKYHSLMEEAISYNNDMACLESQFPMSKERQFLYGNILNLDGDGIMGYVEIPKIDVELPIYHSSDEKVLQKGVGHIEWTSLPVGGEGTHCVLSGHSGLPSAKLFTDLDELEEGDVFNLHILNETLTYKVFKTLVVLPSNIDSLYIKPGEDLCTLVTCTPYGINSHRLLVQGARVFENESSVAVLSSNAVTINPTIVTLLIFVSLMFVFCLSLLISGGIEKKLKRASMARLKNED